MLIRSQSRVNGWKRSFYYAQTMLILLARQCYSSLIIKKVPLTDAFCLIFTVSLHPINYTTIMMRYNYSSRRLYLHSVNQHTYFHIISLKVLNFCSISCFFLLLKCIFDYFHEYFLFDLFIHCLCVVVAAALSYLPTNSISKILNIWNFVWFTPISNMCLLSILKTIVLTAMPSYVNMKKCC